ncbi:MAG: chromosome segregation protein SMC [Bacteroidia bacterium]|nr:chromosome segregation protein SMC [Bacteroidia bacterium]
MQLTSLEIFGFKSFAERTRFVFDKGITGIVGPNGCGKSNVVDSIRWVLGEQKTRNLRSDKMENIIFNGTKTKRKSNFAEVSLTFENTKNILPTEYTTITITRKLYRSGESEYLLNGVTCRLKDIQDLFLDTGVSSDSYAIIELKMVDEMLTNKDNERRKFFEEAAGISKYKVRKKQTLKRLEETDADLERVEDLLFEIDKNLKSLEKQARRTQRYFEIKEQYKQISSQYAFLAVKSIKEEQKQVQILEQNLTDELTSVHAAMARFEARLQELKKELVDNEKMLAHAQAEFNRHLQKIQSVETEKSIKSERLKYLQQREISIQNQIETEKRQLERNESSLAQLNEEFARIEKEFQEQQRKESALKGEKETLYVQNQEESAKTAELSGEHRETEQELQNLTREKEIKRVQIQSLEGELQRAEEDINRRSEDLDVFTEKGKTLESEVFSLEKHFQELSAQQENHITETRTTEQLVNNLKDNVYKTNRLLDARQNEFNLTKSLVENLEGFPESVKFLKKNAQWMKGAPLLSDVFAVPEEYKVAFENYLEPYLSYYVVKTRQDAILSVHLLAEASKGRANFFILEELEHFKSSNPLLFTQAKLALDVVDFAEDYKKLAAFLLSNVYIVQSENDFPDDPSGDTVFITHAGNVSRRKYMVGGGSLGLFEGKRLGRAKNLEKLDKEIAKLQKQLTNEKVELDQASRKLEGLKKLDFRQQIEPVRKELLEKQRDLSVLQSREKEHREFLARVGQRTESLEEELENLRRFLIEIDPKLKTRLEQLQQLTSQVVLQREKTQETSDRLAEITQKFNQEHIRLIHLTNQHSNLQREIDQRTESIERFGETNKKLREELEQVRKDTDHLINSNMQDDEVIVDMYNQKREKEGQVNLLEEKVGMTKNSIHQVETKLSEERKSREHVLQKQADLKEKITEIKLEVTSLRERMSVEFQVEINNLVQEELFDKPLESYDVKEVEEKLLGLRSKVQTYGEINPLAVEAFNEMKERFDFINGQKEDLVEAKKSLLNTIAEIDITAKEKFLETFAKVREHFQVVFRSLFSEDDKCDLLLLDEENPLESEISIIARPKGKRPLTIKQLSGGEKTLTAVALLFAIYLIKPAPFCIFDEVDAPLDDANIDKFNNIIRQFSDTSQFIIVTHNKRTMAATNVMYGVTMENTGVSRLLPVDLTALNLV